MVCLVWSSCLVILMIVTIQAAFEWKSLKLPEEHIPYFFTNNPQIKQQCETDPACPHKAQLSSKKCWGYEEECPVEDRMYSPECPGDAKAWVSGGGKEEQLRQFWEAADFGYVKKRKQELTTICKPKLKGDSSLVCVHHTRYCKADNIFLNFSKLGATSSKDRYREDAFDAGDIGGKCEVDAETFKSFGDHKSALQSWYGELQEFSSLDFNPATSPNNCDLLLDKPTIFMKLDAGSNMYHHFCDFVNLYVAQHINNSFTTDVHLVMWDTSNMNYGDFFSDTWKAFSDYPITYLREYDGKKLCVKDALFPLLPRMRFGMYYNQPVIPGCEKSSLFRAFSQHVLHRLHIKQKGPLRRKLRVTLQQRNTQFRKILNQAEIVEALRKNPTYQINVVDYNPRMPFLDQLQMTLNTDIFLGMHGAGLTHMLFLPDWATVFELYNCEDENCYKDLARLRGVHYMTWDDASTVIPEDEGKHPTMGTAHKKFTNYSFDVAAFVARVAEAADNVRASHWYQEAWRGQWGEEAKEEL